MEHLSTVLVDWSRAQFAVTAIYHWIFVPLTLGLSFIVAFMHTIYFKTQDEKWKKMTKFWMKLFGINFAIGVATGIIMEFEFGTNWSNYSWIVGDIFGAPLAIEGIMAFFLESTFVALMFFGWGRISKRFHMMSSWLVAVGSNLSALWILVANAWMQNPQGTKFNLDTARSEMTSFLDVALSETAIFKFLHTVSQAYIVAALFVLAVSAWYLLKGRHLEFARKSIVIGAVFGLIASVFTIATGDSSAYDVAQKQPMKLAAMEGLYDGQTNAPLNVIGVLNDEESNDNFVGIKIPSLLSLMAYRDASAFVPGINDLVDGNEEQGIISTEEKMRRGKIAIQSFADYKKAKEMGDDALAASSKESFEENYDYLGYGYLNSKEEAVPPVKLTFYAFHIMVALGMFFILLFAWMIYASYKGIVDKYKWILKLSVISIILGFVATQLGWIVAEFGRQPWTIQDLLPVHVATSHLSVGAVQTSFFVFFALFTVLLIAEIKIMTAQIKKGPEEGGSHV